MSCENASWYCASRPAGKEAGGTSEKRALATFKSVPYSILLRRPQSCRCQTCARAAASVTAKRLLCPRFSRSFVVAFSRHLSFFTLFPPKANRINKTRSGREGGEDRLYSRCYDIITLQQVKIYGRRFILTPICRRRRRRLRITYTYQSVFHHKKSRPSCYLWQFAFTHVHACKHALQYSTMIQ